MSCSIITTVVERGIDLLPRPRPHVGVLERPQRLARRGLEAQRATILAVIKERKLRERRELFEEGLIQTLKSKGVIKVYDDAVKRLAATYRQGA